ISGVLAKAHLWATGGLESSARTSRQCPYYPHITEAPMIVGVPKEIKSDEYRVAMVPAGVEELTRAGHAVLIQAGAGAGSGISDEMYAANGAEIVAATADIWRRSEMIVKVKEPIPAEWPLMRPGQTVFTYFHFAA